MDELDHLYFEYQHTIRSYDIGMDKKATVPALIQIMHEAAMKHVLKLGLSAFELEKQNLAWVLIQQRFELIQSPLLGETIIIKTNPSGLERVITYRDFRLYNQSGELLAQASTSWLLMNTATRKMARYPEDISKSLLPTNDFEHLQRPERKLKPLETVEQTVSFPIRYYDLDFNGHLSNFYYMKWMLVSLGTEFLKGHQLTDFEIKIQGESIQDETLEAEIQSISSETFLHTLRKGDQVVAIGKTNWKK